MSEAQVLKHYKMTILKTDGTEEPIEQNFYPNLDQLHKLIDCDLVERVRLNLIIDGEPVQKDMLVDESGLYSTKLYNDAATKLYRETAFNNTGRESGAMIIGNAVVFENFNLR